MRRPAPAAKRPVAVRTERCEYEPQEPRSSYSHCSFLTVRGYAAPPDVRHSSIRAIRVIRG